jgi:hypothetical protein
MIAFGKVATIRINDRFWQSRDYKKNPQTQEYQQRRHRNALHDDWKKVKKAIQRVANFQSWRNQGTNRESNHGWKYGQQQCNAK